MEKTVSRHNFIKSGATAVGTLAALGALSKVARALAAFGPSESVATGVSKVYFTRDLSAESLHKMYALVNGQLTGKTAVTLHTGEPHGSNIIPREWGKALMPDIPKGTIVETNVFYASPRQTTEGHRETLRRLEFLRSRHSGC